MARTWFKNKQLTRQTLTGTVTAASVLALTFSPAASTRYFGIWSLQGDNSVTNRNAAHKVDDTTGAVNLANVTTRTSSATDVFSAGGIFAWTAGGSPGSQTFDVTHAPGNTADTVGSDEIFLMMLKEEATDGYAESLAADSTTSSTLADRATLSITPASAGDYLIIASAEAGGLIAATANGVCRALLDIDGVEYFDTVDGIQANTGGTRYAWTGACVVNLTAAAHTLKVRYASSDNINTANIRNTRILAIRLDSFNDNATDQDSTEQSTSSTSYVTAATATDTAVATDHMVLASSLFRYNTSARKGQVQVSSDGVARSGFTRANGGSGGVRYANYTGFGYDTFAAGSRTAELQWDTSNAGDTAYVVDAFVGMFNLDAAEWALSPTDTVSPTEGLANEVTVSFADATTSTDDDVIADLTVSGVTLEIADDVATADALAVDVSQALADATTSADDALVLDVAAAWSDATTSADDALTSSVSVSLVDTAAGDDGVLTDLTLGPVAYTLTLADAATGADDRASSVATPRADTATVEDAQTREATARSIDISVDTCAGSYATVTLDAICATVSLEDDRICAYAELDE